MKLVAMETKDIHQEIFFKASPLDIYELLMDPYKHAELVGSTAEIDNREGGKFNIYDGYITGTNVKLVPGKEIIQKWRAEEEGWPFDYFSDLTFIMKAENGGTKLTMTQTGIPSECTDAIGEGWHEFYWTPMHEIMEDL